MGGWSRCRKAARRGLGKEKKNDDASRDLRVYDYLLVCMFAVLCVRKYKEGLAMRRGQEPARLQRWECVGRSKEPTSVGDERQILLVFVIVPKSCEWGWKE